MQIAIRGSGTPLILLHGWGMHSGVFAALADVLAEQHTLYLVDLPGHGHSRDETTPLEANACVQAIVDNTPPAAWLGWSLGGLLSLHAALHRTQSVQALVMLCALPRFVRAPDWPHGMDADTFTTFGNELARDYRGTLERFIALETLGSEDAAVELRLLRAQVFAHGDPAPRALQQGLRLLEQTDLRADLPALAVPSLWLAGRRDRLADWRAMQASATLAPNARFHRIEGAAHAPFLTHVDEVSAQVLAFLADVDADSFANAPAAVA